MERIVFFGDSITDCNRDYEAEIGTESQLGDGYVKYINAELFINYGFQYQLINQGVNGNRITDLLNRIEEVVHLRPEKVFIMIGINDIWRHFDSQFMDILQIEEDVFRESYEKIISVFLKNNIKLYISSAYYLEQDQSNMMRIKLNRYNEITKDLCQKYGIPFLDMQREMDELMKRYSSYIFSHDQVHMNYLGNYVLANKIYKFLIEKEDIR